MNVLHGRPSGISLRCPTPKIWPSQLLQFLAACAVLRLKAAGGENNLSFFLGHKSREDLAPPPKCGFVRSHRSESGFAQYPDSLRVWKPPLPTEFSDPILNAGFRIHIGFGEPHVRILPKVRLSVNGAKLSLVYALDRDCNHPAPVCKHRLWNRYNSCIISDIVNSVLYTQAWCLFTNIFILARPITVICVLPWRPVKIHKIMAHVQQNTV